MLFAAPVAAQRIRPGPTMMQSQAPQQTSPFIQAPQAQPQESSELNSRIVAVVNDSVVSSTDLNSRVAMALISSGLPDTPEVRHHLIIQLLHAMVDEQLELQEAKKNGILVTSSDVDQAMDKIAKENNIPGGDMKAFLASRGIPANALIGQIRASLAWNKVIQRELRPKVDVGDDEIDAVIDRTRANAGKQEYQVSEIFLPVETPKDEDQVKQFAESLVQQLRQGGNFGNIARQFSQNASASGGGDIGWIEDNQLPSELNKAIEDLNTGEITPPIRTASGYEILGLRDKRTISEVDVKDVTAQIQQVFRPFTDNPNKQQMLDEAAKLRSTITSCTDIKGKLKKGFSDWQWQDLGTVRLATSPPWLAEKARDLPIGKPSDAMAINNGALIIYVCDRSASDGNAARETITNQIGTEKLELQARGLLRDLRRDAYLDVRLGSPTL